MSLFTRIFSRKISNFIEMICWSLENRPQNWYILYPAYDSEHITQRHNGIEIRNGRIISPVRYKTTRRESKKLKKAIAAYKSARLLEAATETERKTCGKS